MEERKNLGGTSEYGINDNKMLTFKVKVYVPNQLDLKERVMKEYHRSNYAGHQGYQKMLTMIKKVFFWHGM